MPPAATSASRATKTTTMAIRLMARLMMLVHAPPRSSHALGAAAAAWPRRMGAVVAGSARTALRRIAAGAAHGPGQPPLRAKPTSIDDEAADAGAGAHQIEALVDVIDGQRVGDQGIDGDFFLHVPVDDLWHVGASTRTAEGRTLPHPPGDQLEGTRRDLLAG